MSKPLNYPESPKDLWNIFYDFTQTPRPSKNEDQIVKYLVNLAEKNKLKYKVDKASNVIIYVPGKNGRENDAPVIIQNHIDMVTDALPNIKINFKEDPIETEVDGEWLTAKGTTLGADNGIGCAASLAVIFDENLVHPPLELLFTTDEETGLNGALGLETEYLKGRKMLNLDTEEWGSLYIGCAGGLHYDFNRDFELVEPKLQKKIKISISDLVGGHSGIDIHKQHGNAIKLLVDFLNELKDRIPFELEEFRSGKAHNIIPRDAYALLNIEEKDFSLVEKLIVEMKSEWLNFLPKVDQGLKFSIEKLELNTKKVYAENDLAQILNFLTLFPSGAHAFDLPSNREIVSMSNNLAIVIVMNGKFYALTSLRFFDRGEVKSLEKKLIALGKTFGMTFQKASEYPSWKPVRDNSVLDTVKSVYKELYQSDAIVTAIHAGLECGILRDKIGPIDVCSFGPTITGAHSPDERVNIPSVEQFWNLFINVLKRI